MKHRILSSIITSVAILVAAGGSSGQHNMEMKPGMQATPKASFQRDMRTLWEDHITWTRLYIVSALADLPDKDAAANRLLQNQSDIGNAVKSFYGDAAGEKLTGLLKGHILIAADLIAGVKTGDTSQSNQAGTRWAANADSIAAFLSEANPKQWPAIEMKAMMRGHLAATTDEVLARLGKDWEGDVRAYEKVHRQILGMADMLSSGIMAQFPARFN